MSEAELWDRLEKALHTRITTTERATLEADNMISMYTTGGVAFDGWPDFKAAVDKELKKLRRHVENTRREERGEPLLEAKIPERLPEPTAVMDVRAPLSDRTAARARALSASDQLRLGAADPDRVRSRTMSARVRPQGGFDEALSQWVIELEIEAWVPADDVRNIYQHVQRDLLAEEASPKTQPHTFRVAQFVWEEELRCGDRPSWPILFKRWREQNPNDNSFTSWQAFHNCFKRGEKATRPRYAQSNDYIASEARRLKHLEEQWEEGPRFGLSRIRRRLF